MMIRGPMKNYVSTKGASLVRDQPITAKQYTNDEITMLLLVVA